MKNEERLCNLTALIWKYYLMEPTKEHFEEIFTYLSDELVMIGTGKHEFFTNIEQIIENLTGNLGEAENIRFELLDEWYECQMLSQDIYVVYGGIWVRQQECLEGDTLIEMDTRFSIIYRKQNEKYEMIHLHHSVPYVEQQNGEYYPKTLKKKIEDAMTLAKMFEKKSELDLMTEVYNNISFKHHVNDQLNCCDNGYMYLFDLDHFKVVNDTYGHMKGDELLKLFAGTLKRSFGSNAIIGRMGGDEFAVFEYEPVERKLAIERLTKMQNEFNAAAKDILGESTASFSVGVASMTEEQQYNTIFSNADKALYRAKQLGRGTYYW